jgi:hypothetical protein
MASMSDWLFSGKLVQFPDVVEKIMRGNARRMLGME